MNALHRHLANKASPDLCKAILLAQLGRVKELTLKDTIMYPELLEMLLNEGRSVHEQNTALNYAVLKDQV